MNDNPIMEPVATTPEEPVTEPTDIPPVENPAEEPVTEPAEDTTPPTVTDDEPPAPPAPFLTAKFNHEQRDLTREEALKYAQLGMKYESEQGMRDQLEMMAAGRGQSPQEFLNAWSRAEEQALFDQKMQITHGNEEAARLLVKAEMDARQNARNIRVQQAEQAEQQAELSLQDRLASEYAELRTECPEIGEFDTIPQAVVDDAIRNGRHLFDAYLRYQRREGQKIQQNQTAQQTAAAATVGSQADNPPADGMDAVTAAMMKAVWS